MKSFFAFIAMLLTATISAQENNVQAPPDNGFTQTLVMIAIALLFFYLILWRPEQKRRKAMDTLRNSLNKGDKVTAMGIVGTISRIQEHTVILRMVDGSKIEMLKAAISEVVPGTEEDKKRVEKEEVRSSKKIDISEVEQP
jgi:preprotein translocase subunit YajC